MPTTEPRYRVLVDQRCVYAWSTVRLPFEPRGEMLAYRDELRSALRALSAGPGEGLGEGLVATYAAPDRAFADVENVALYNVGSGSFSHLTGEGLVCGRSVSFDGLHHLSYRVGPMPDPAGRAVGGVLARVPVADPVLVSAKVRTATDWWRLLRPRLEVSTERVGPAPFVVDVTLGGDWSGPAVAGVVKPLLDGLVGALGCHDGSGRESLLPRLAALGDPGQMWRELCDRDRAVLGARALVRPHGPSGVVWNPADELCEAFRFAVDGDKPSRRVSLTATWL